MTPHFESVSHLNNWLIKNKTLIFESEPKRLKRIAILLHALAGGDFNPAHISGDFAKHSIFKGVVSHGIGVVSRAEGVFVEMMQFKEPVEIIATGYESITYHKPLRLDSWYYYEFRITNMRRVKKRWDFDCEVFCRSVAPDVTSDSILISSWKWKPSFIDHDGLSDEVIQFLKPKSYLRNVLDQFIIQPAGNMLVIGLGLALLLSGIIIVILQLCGVIKPYEAGISL